MITILKYFKFACGSFNSTIQRAVLCTMSINVQKLIGPFTLGEGPHWDEKQQALYFVDVNRHAIHKYVPATSVHTKTKLDGSVSFIIPVEDTIDQFVVGVKVTFQIIQWDGAEGTPVKVLRDFGTVENKPVLTTRINDGKVDPRGRLFAGTMGLMDSSGKIQENLASLYRVDDGGIQQLCDGISISNGLAWDLKRKALYYINSLECNIRRYDYNVDTGEISNMKFIFNLKENNIEGFPDGQTIDTDGNLWVAVFEGSCVIKIDPTIGKLLQKVPIPAEKVTSVAFGGPDLEVLYVTSANFNEHPEPPNGCLFTVTGLGVKGQPSFNFKNPQ